MSGKRLDASWAGWLAENLRRGCNPEELLGILLSNAFDIRSIKSAMGAHYPVHSPLALAAEGRDPDPIDVETIAHPRLVLPGSGAVRFDTELMQLYTIERFLDDATCDELCEVVDRNLRRSTVTLVSEPGYRSSRTSDLGLLDAPVVARVDLQIAQSGVNVTRMNAPTVTVDYSTPDGDGSCGPYTLPKPPAGGQIDTFRLSDVNPSAASA
jgi:hypothetical protein